MGLRAQSPAMASLRVAWQGAYGANRTRGSRADLGHVCSVVAWPCPVRSRGCCRLDRMLYTIGVMLRGQALLHLEGRTSIHPRHPGYRLAVPDKSIRVQPHPHQGWESWESSRATDYFPSEGSNCDFFYFHPPVLSSAPIRERNHGHTTVRNGVACWSVWSVSPNIPKFPVEMCTTIRACLPSTHLRCDARKGMCFLCDCSTSQYTSISLSPLNIAVCHSLCCMPFSPHGILDLSASTIKHNCLPPPHSNTSLSSWHQRMVIVM